MDTFRILLVTVLVIFPVYASTTADQAPQTFESSESNKKREVQGEATYPLLLEQLQRPQPTSQPQYEVSYQPEANTLAKAEEPRYFTPNPQYRPQLHFVPLDAMEQFIHQHATPPSEQTNVQKNYYFVQQPEFESQKNQHQEQEKEQREQVQLQQRFNQQQQQERQQLELEHQVQQQEIQQQQQNQQHQIQQEQIHQQQIQQQQIQQEHSKQQQIQQLQIQQEHSKQQQIQQLQILQNQLNQQENQQKTQTQYFIPTEPKLQLIPYQPQELLYGQQKPEYSQQTGREKLPRQQFINIQYIAPHAQSATPQLIEQKPQILQIQLLPNPQQDKSSIERPIGNHLSTVYSQQYDTLQQYAPSYNTQLRLAEISEEIEKSKLRSAAQADAIARSPPVVVQKHVSITRHRPVEITKHVTVPVPSPIAVPIPTPIKIDVPQPYAVPVEIIRPFAVPIVQTKTIEVDRPVPFEVEKRVPVEVEKKVYYKVDRPVTVEKRVPVEVTREIPVEVPIHKPQTLEIVRHVWEKKGLW